MTAFDDVLQERTRAMEALAKSVNLFLAVKIAAFEGNEQLRDFIEYIEERIPNGYAHCSDEAPFQAFYIGQNFIVMVSEFEGFLVDVMKLVIKAHPKKLGSESFKLSELLEIRDIDVVTEIAADRYLNSLMYKRANEYRRAFADLLSGSDDFLGDLWPRYVECKARRDVGIHNGWRVNETYNRKVAEIGMAPCADEFAPPSNAYFWSSTKLFAQLATDIVEHCNAKFAMQGV